MPDPRRPQDVLLHGLAVALADGPAAAAPGLQAAITAFRETVLSAEEGLRWLGFSCAAATLLWDHESWELLATRHVQAARNLGALTVLPLALNSLAVTSIFGGALFGGPAGQRGGIGHRRHRQPFLALRRGAARRAARA